MDLLGRMIFCCPHGMLEEEKITVATISQDGEVLALFQWEDGRRPIRGWLQFKSRLLDRFSHTQDGTLCEQFLSLRKEGSVRDSLGAIELLDATLEDVPEHIY